MWSPIVLGLATLMIFVGCANTPPKEEYILARAAMDAAREIEAARYAQSYWHLADQAYRKAEEQYQNRNFQEAEAQFIKARIYAEKAELAAKIVRHKQGDGF